MAFDGTSNITISTSVAANALTGTTLAAGVVSSSLTSVGTIVTGVWNATAVAAAYGGTGQASYTVGDILQASTTTALSKLAAVATGNALISGGVGTVSSWGKIGLTTHVSGTLPVANGGTGVTASTGSGSNVLSASPTLTGTPLAPTASGGTNTTQIATTAFVQANKSFTLSTVQATTSGTSKDFTIPSGVKQIKVMFKGVSTNGSSNPIIRIGTGSTPATTGYTCVASYAGATSGGGSSTIGFFLYSADTTAIDSGVLTFDLQDAATNTWVASGTLCISGGGTYGLITSGYVSLAGELDIVRLTTVSGTDSFDAGSVNVAWL